MAANIFSLEICVTDFLYKMWRPRNIEPTLSHKPSSWAKNKQIYMISIGHRPHNSPMCAASNQFHSFMLSLQAHRYLSLWLWSYAFHAFTAFSFVWSFGTNSSLYSWYDCCPCIWANWEYLKMTHKYKQHIHILIEMTDLVYLIN